jgi:hypothetical protein
MIKRKYQMATFYGAVFSSSFLVMNNFPLTKGLVLLALFLVGIAFTAIQVLDVYKEMRSDFIWQMSHLELTRSLVAKMEKLEGQIKEKL